MSARLDPGTVVRLAVLGNGCALSVGNRWVLSNRVPSNLTAGGFLVRRISEFFKVGGIRFAAGT